LGSSKKIIEGNKESDQRPQKFQTKVVDSSQEGDEKHYKMLDGRGTRKKLKIFVKK